jgi:hypothetical protein
MLAGMNQIGKSTKNWLGPYGKSYAKTYLIIYAIPQFQINNINVRVVRRISRNPKFN